MRILTNGDAHAPESAISDLAVRLYRGVRRALWQFLLREEPLASADGHRDDDQRQHRREAGGDAETTTACAAGVAADDYAPTRCSSDDSASATTRTSAGSPEAVAAPAATRHHHVAPSCHGGIPAVGRMEQRSSQGGTTPLDLCSLALGGWRLILGGCVLGSWVSGDFAEVEALGTDDEGLGEWIGGVLKVEALSLGEWS
ncbi:hypothetical protein KM043_011739 [Ampulex compressa]|nr:hypothetical protein KM043_011739 [Ampulex compressa]